MKETYIVAVSGGVDSVVLLDMLARADHANLVVAHFDHGIREDSFEDAAFVQELAQKYGLAFELGQAQLGGAASEEAGRTARYAFLRALAQKHQARIVTAHHADDVLETMIINISRGTGWRGLASLRSTDEIRRPLLQYRKQQLLEYAKARNLTWHEDSTNVQTKYLRNHIRLVLMPRLGAEVQQWLLDKYWQQVELRREIEAVAVEIIDDYKKNGEYGRYIFIMSEEKMARELLYEVVRAETAQSLTRPQLERAVLAMKTARENTRYEAGSGVVFSFTKRGFKVVTR